MSNVALSWNANAPGEFITGYQVWGANGTSTAFGSCTLLATVNALTWTEVGLPASQARTYYLVAVNSYGSSSPDGPMNITTPASGGGTGDVVGPSSAVNNHVAFFDGTTGKLIKDSGLALSGSNTGDQVIPVGSNPSATAGDTAINGSASSFMRSDGAPAIQKGSSSVFGIVKVDGSTITATAGVISAVGGGGAPAGSSSDVQYNDAGSFGAVSNPDDPTYFLNGDSPPEYAQVKDSDLSTSDITTNNVSTSKHGFAPKAPNDATKYLDGTGAYSVPAGGGGSGVSRLFSAFASVGNGADTTEDLLQTYTLPGGTLATNGQAIRVRVRGQYSGTTASKFLRLYFGATNVCFITNTATVQVIDIEATIMRVDGTHQITIGAAKIAASSSTAIATQFTEQSAPAETLSGNIVIKVTGQSSVGTANLVTCDFMLVELLP